MQSRIGIIGAGMAGAWLANQLTQAGHDVVVFEKSRGLGGRMATRRMDDIAFDHGAPFFTASTERFQELVSAQSDVCELWQPRVVNIAAGSDPFPVEAPAVERYVGVPGMGALCKSLLDGVFVQRNFEVRELVQATFGWQVIAADGTQAEVDWVISTAPAEQTLNLMPAAPLDDVAYHTCFALMAYLDAAPAYDMAVVEDSILEKLFVTASRPGRAATPGLVAHATPEWSGSWFEQDRTLVAQEMEQALQALGVQVGSAASLQRWRYARVATPHGNPYWINKQAQLAACGDWGVGPNVEDAFTSANQLLARILNE